VIAIASAPPRATKACASIEVANFRIQIDPALADIQHLPAGATDSAETVSSVKWLQCVRNAVHQLSSARSSLYSEVFHFSTSRRRGHTRRAHRCGYVHATDRLQFNSRHSAGPMTSPISEETDSSIKPRRCSRNAVHNCPFRQLFTLSTGSSAHRAQASTLIAISDVPRGFPPSPSKPH